jgi:putative selenium metabolism protein SsnA
MRQSTSSVVLVLADLLIKNGILVTMDSRRRILEGHGIAVGGGKIIEVNEVTSLEKKYPSVEVIDAAGRIVMPGIICSHSHLYGMLLRGAPLNIEPPSDFTQILQRVWWPMDEAMNFDDAYASALVACLEFAKSGVTTFADTYSGPNSISGVLDYIGKAVEEVGIRGFIAFEVTERHSVEEGEKGVLENVRFAEKVQPDSRVRPLLSIHASFTVSDPLIRRVKQLSLRHKTPITIHASEGLVDLHHNLENYGKRTIERLSDVGLLGPDVVLAHCVNLDEHEIDLVSKTGTGIAHNPMSNMLNAVGVAPVLEMLKRNITVGLGNDGYIFDMFENMRTAFLLHRVHHRDPNVIDPYTILEMATINGAKLYGLQNEIGSLEPGKKADIILIKPSVLPTPLNASTVLGHLINTVDGDDVETVLVAGKPIVKNKKLLTFDETKAQIIAQTAAVKLWDRMKTMKPQVDPIRK